MENIVRQLNLFFDDIKTRVRMDGICQFKKGDRFLDYIALGDNCEPSVIEILSSKKHKSQLQQSNTPDAGKPGSEGWRLMLLQAT